MEIRAFAMEQCSKQTSNQKTENKPLLFILLDCHASNYSLFDVLIQTPPHKSCRKASLEKERERERCALRLLRDLKPMIQIVCCILHKEKWKYWWSLTELLSILLKMQAKRRLQSFVLVDGTSIIRDLVRHPTREWFTFKCHLLYWYSYLLCKLHSQSEKGFGGMRTNVYIIYLLLKMSGCM